VETGGTSKPASDLLAETGAASWALPASSLQISRQRDKGRLEYYSTIGTRKRRAEAPGNGKATSMQGQ